MSATSLHADWIVPTWPAPAQVRACATSRAGGVSTGAFASFNLGFNTPDTASQVAHNRALLQRRCATEIVWLRQTHSITVLQLDQAAAAYEQPPCADASVCRHPLRACAVLTADCLPVLLCDRAGSVIGAAHAGWRGLAAGILEATVAAMACERGALMAWLGPAIGATAYVVGEEVRAAFMQYDKNASTAFKPAAEKGKWLADLYTLARQRLARVGVEDVFGGDLCTLSDPARFYSWRRDGEQSGRMASLIWLDAV